MGQATTKHHDIVVIGTSLGGIEALSALIPALPADLPASILIVVHIHPHSPCMLDRVLGPNSRLPIKFAQHGETLQQGHIYLAPPDHHLLVEDSRLLLIQGPRENRARPAIDPLFRSAAVACTTRVIGVILTGLLDDGTSGLAAIKSCGGIAIVQDPSDAQHSEMPELAMESVAVDHVVKLAGLAQLLTQLVSLPAGPGPQVPRSLRLEVEISKGLGRYAAQEKTLGELIPLVCPDCGGSLSELREGTALHYRCHVGHAYNPESLVSAQRESVEYSLWAAVRTLEEQASMLKRLATRQVGAQAERYDERAGEITAHAERIKQFLMEELRSNS